MCRVGRRARVDDRTDVLIDVSVAVAESTIGSDPAGLGYENMYDSHDPAYIRHPDQVQSV